MKGIETIREATMRVLMLVITLVACYFPAVAGARGRGSRKLWIGLFCVGLCIALGAIALGGAQSIWIPNPDAVSILYEIIIRTAIGFTFGSFLAVLLYRKKPSIKGLNLGSNK
jgi:hypothetical protein